MSVISFNKKELKRVRKEIKKLDAELCKLYEEERQCVKIIQGTCSHPEEYQDTIWTNTDKDLLEAKHYIVKCLACDKKIDEYNMVNGRRHEVSKERNYY